MEKIDINTTLIILGITAIVAELALGVATGFDLLVVGVVLLISGSVGIVVGSYMVSLGVVVVLLFGYVFLGRKMVKGSLVIKTQKTNVDALIGKKAVVVEKTSPQNPGQVKINGEIWRAEADTVLDENTHVVVHSVSGVTLAVTK